MFFSWPIGLYPSIVRYVLSCHGEFNDIHTTSSFENSLPVVKLGKETQSHSKQALNSPAKLVLTSISKASGNKHTLA